MKPTWKKYLLYGSVIIVGVLLAFILIETVRAKNTGFETKTLWDWMELLVIPLVLAGGALYLERSERAVDRKTREERAKLEREIATDRQQEAALQSYLDRMAELLLQDKLRITKDKEVRNVARIRTLTVLLGLDGKRKGIVLLFLHESRLIIGEPIVDLTGADFSEVQLEGAILNAANLTKTNLKKAQLGDAHLNLASLRGADLAGASLNGAELHQADLEEADLDEAELGSAFLTNANLKKAHLSGARLGSWRQEINEKDVVAIYWGPADLSGANLSGAWLVESGFGKIADASLNHVNLSGANLRGAAISGEQLATAASLKGAIMPDGKIHH